MIKKSNYEIVEVGDEYLLVPISDEAQKFKGVITINKEAASLMRQLETPKEFPDLVDFIVSEYGVEEGIASKDVRDFLKQLNDIGVLEI